ncbi:Phage portal protein, SPP1 Gp6-like [Brevibacterium casei]|uniref:Phage portal protein, SPP1 Gp6-like n=1 Tax=Brevibacterium casei TaxID=33889 RepID=A0A449D7H4_9MICO|nr:phage portal protein [Brevibacterium casei]VEW13551.1 Phage portal protein, SPP1 Gp6-like [Brevibacterium casei]
MDEAVARERLEVGLAALLQQAPEWLELEKYHRGEHDLPFSPRGIGTEYADLREISKAPWLRLVTKTPVQRLRVDGIRSSRSANADEARWANVWKANGLDSRQRIVYTDAVVHGRGVFGVWPNVKDRTKPIVRPESPRGIFISPKEDDPFESDWAIKAFGAPGLKWFEANPATTAIIYDESRFVRFQRIGDEWVVTKSAVNPLRRVPFVEFSPSVDAEGRHESMIKPLIPAQKAIDVVRFDLLLAAQFAAYRQRIVTGYDPVIRDPETGEPMWQTDSQGNVRLDSQGQPIPLVSSPGRPGVDRLMVFPGADTNVFDLPESNLSNYVTVVNNLVQHLAAVSQVPPQYLLGGLANLSGEALAAAESTLAALVADMQLSFGASFEQVMNLAGIAAGDDEMPSEVIWGDGQARSFSQTVDGIQKLISIGFPVEAGLEMLPGATLEKVRRWMTMMDNEQKRVVEIAKEQSMVTTEDEPDDDPDGD